jgi:hypothetical protein
LDFHRIWPWATISLFSVKVQNGIKRQVCREVGERQEFEALRVAIDGCENFEETF